ncbi:MULTISPECIES: SDR family oxidoreductase [Protofrankia]|uniref:SDR family oxidoreductase n=1 Tax=Protofrankia TaxID=2994361 RepID=UPI00069B1A55|nr:MULTISPECIES: SDR family oxidoreductase [Protofrankia]ONH33542.1 hypothetical protein BL254_19815 [Protofrankia sp. BMG5.30]
MPRAERLRCVEADIEGLARALAVDRATDGILVNAIAPGFFGASIGTAFTQSERLHKQVASRIPPDRIGQTSELASPASFLAGNACDHLTEYALGLDGGHGLDQAVPASTEHQRRRRANDTRLG